MQTEFAGVVHVSGLVQFAMAAQAWHEWPSDDSTYPGAQLVQTELAAVAHDSGLVQFGMGVQDVHTVGTVVLRQ